MTRVIVTVLGRPWWLEPTLFILRERALQEVRVTCVVDGDPAIPWHYTKENERIANKLADVVVVAGKHLGNGPAFAWGVQAGPMDQPIIKCDADVLPSLHYDFGLMSAARGFDNGKLFGLVGLQPHEDRTNVGIRRIGPNRKFTINLAVFTPRALALMGDHAVPHPMNYHERRMLAVADGAGLWYGVTERAWVDTHLGMWDGLNDAYRQWKTPYLYRSS